MLLRRHFEYDPIHKNHLFDWTIHLVNTTRFASVNIFTIMVLYITDQKLERTRTFHRRPSSVNLSILDFKPQKTEETAKCF